MSTFGERLQQAIKDHGYSNNDFSVITKISKAKLFAIFTEDAAPDLLDADDDWPLLFEFQAIILALPRTDVRWLISSAPEMLEALQELVKAFGVDGLGAEYEDGECQVIDRARKLITQVIGDEK